MKAILYTKQDCQKCEYVKERIFPGVVEIRDITDAQAHRKELIRNGLIEIVQKTMPVLLIDGEIVTSAAHIVSRINEIA